jgi:hypothetical protein
MTAEQGVLALVRSGDPRSSTVGAARARTTSQKAVILRLLYRYDEAFGAAVSSIDADRLYGLHPETQRSVWSTRLSAMRRAGLLVCDRDADPIVFRLSDLGRVEAKRLTR